MADQTPKVIWKPLEGSQTLALSCPADVLLFHGTRGPGKTDAQLMRFRRNVGRGYGNFWRGVIFDKEYKNLDDLVSKSQRWFPQFDDGAKFLRSQGDYRWVWPTGEELLIRTIKKESDYWGYHGQEFPFIGWNELTKYASDGLFDMMMSCNRSSFRPIDHPLTIDGGIYAATGNVVIVGQGHKKAEQYLLPEIPLEVFATTNPLGVGHHWVKERFILAGKPGEIVRTETLVFNPRTQNKEIVVRTQTHLFGSYRENIYLSPEYIAELEKIKDPNKRKAWLHGSWDVTSGGMFDDLWDMSKHVLPNFQIPGGWRIDRALDWGSSRPFSVGWWAESDGSPAIIGGKQRTFPRGTLFRIGEWYGCTGKPNEGLRLSANRVGLGILDRDVEFGVNGRVQPGPADSSIYDVTDDASIADNMARVGVRWHKADKRPGSRKNGWQLLRDRLEAVVDNSEKPGIYVMERCTNFIRLVPTLPRDEIDQDDVDTEAEDHIGDEVRYRVLATKGRPFKLIMGYAR